MTYEDADAEDVLHLELNTNLVGRNPVLDELDSLVGDLSRYPAKRSDRLREAVSERTGLDVASLVCSNGADALLDIALRALAEPGDGVAFPWPGFEMYPRFAELCRLEIHRVPLADDLSVPLDGLRSAAARVTILARPNNPTGDVVPEDDLLDLLDDLPGVLVLDEAYIEYADAGSLLPRVADRRDLVVVRTLSKAHGLAGLRVGYAAAHPDTAAELARARPPFNLGTVGETVAARSVEDGAFARGSADVVAGERKRLTGALADRGFDVRPSQGNFVLARAPVDPFDLRDALRERKILVRVFPDEPELSRHVRVTVGRPEHTDRLLEALDEVLP